jgi:hypothetical protein
MASFQTIVSYTAIFLFLLLMIVLGILMNQSGMNTKFPPQVGACPDYWQRDASTGKCLNVQNLGINCPSPANFNTPEFLGPDGNKNKCNFAKNCSIEWDGITGQNLC